jgi:hypothetical protein
MLGLALFISFLGLVGTVAGGIVIYRNRDIVFPKKHTA